MALRTRCGENRNRKCRRCTTCSRLPHVGASASASASDEHDTHVRCMAHIPTWSKVTHSAQGRGGLWVELPPGGRCVSDAMTCGGRSASNRVLLRAAAGTMLCAELSDTVPLLCQRRARNGLWLRDASSVAVLVTVCETFREQRRWREACGFPGHGLARASLTRGNIPVGVDGALYGVAKAHALCVLQ